MDFNAFIDELLARTDIVQVVSRYVPLTRKGKTHWGCCPFHHEKDPSFAVNEDKQFYHCFGCKESGNAITFVQKMESIEWYDAVKILAQEAKMEIPKSASFKNADGVTREKKERLTSLMREAAKHYHENLNSPQGKIARDYIEDRKIGGSLATRFGFGYSISGGEMINYLENKGYTKAEMKEAGLIEQRADEWYDVFYKRLIIPIINNLGEVIAFGGRLITPETHIAVKYRNSSNTPIFDKSRTLYAINLLKKKKQRENIKYVIVAEGYMDVIALHKAGFDTAVASMGTALTYAQAKLIRNYSTNVYISYDGDGAGQAATLRGLDILRSAGLNVKVVSLPDGLDPDDLIKKFGANAYQKCLDEALYLPAFKLKVLKEKYDLNDPDGKSKYAIEAIKVIKALENPVEQEEYLKIVHNDTGYSFDALRKQAGITEESAKPTYERTSAYEETTTATATRDKAELFVLSSLVHGRDFVRYDEDIYPYLSLDIDRKIYAEVIDKYKKGEKFVVSSLFTRYDEGSVSEIVNYDFIQGDDESKYKSCLFTIKKRYLESEHKRLSVEAEKETDFAKKIEILKQIQKLTGEIMRLKSGGEDD